MNVKKIIEIAKKNNEQIQIIGRTGTGSALKNLSFLMELEDNGIYYDIYQNKDKMEIYF